MKKLAVAVVLFSIAAVAGTLFVWWDTAPALVSGPKYRLSEIGSKLGPEIQYAMPAPSPLWTFYCDPEVGGEKNCGPAATIRPVPAVIHTVPLPGTLWLILPALAWLGWRARR